MSTNPKKELEKFLAPLAGCVQKRLLYQPLSPQDLLEWVNTQCDERELRTQIESLLRQIPSQWNEYCGRAHQEREERKLLREMIDVELPRGRAGRPCKESLAEEAAPLKQRGMNNYQIAAKLNSEHGAGTTTPEAIRKLLKRYPQPDKI